MADFALVDSVGIRAIETFAGTPSDPSGKGWKWLPIVIVGDDPFDPATQIKEGPVYSGTIADTQATKTFTIRAKTAEEIDADKQMKVDGMDFVAMRILFNHENRIRALESKPAITADQFKAAIKALL